MHADQQSRKTPALSKARHSGLTARLRNSSHAPPAEMLGILASWHMDSFERVYDHRSLRAEKRRNAARTMRKFKVPSLAAPMLSAEAASEQAVKMDLFRDRLRLRRQCEKDVLAQYPDGLPSSKSQILKLLVSKTRRARKGLLVGSDKAVVRPCASKLLGLEERYIVTNEAMRGCIRVDIDRSFADWAALKRAIAECQAPMPNIIAHEPASDGSVRNPHLLYVIMDSVCWSGKGSSKAKSLLKAIERGLVALLLPAGADPGGLSNPLKIKNPLSPDMSMILASEVAFQLSNRNSKKARAALPALADLVPLDVGREALMRWQADQNCAGLVDSDSHPTSSNRVFNELTALAHSKVRALRCKEGDAGTEADLLAALQKHVEENYARPWSRALKTAEDVASWVWARHDPSRTECRERDNMGVLKDRMDGLDLKDRMRVGAAYTHERVRTKSEDRVIVGQQALLGRGEDPSVMALVRETGLARNTVRDALKRIANQESGPRDVLGGVRLKWAMIKRKSPLKEDCGPDGERLNTTQGHPDRSFPIDLVTPSIRVVRNLRHATARGSTRDVTIPAKLCPERPDRGVVGEDDGRVIQCILSHPTVLKTQAMAYPMVGSSGSDQPSASGRARRVSGRYRRV